MAPEEIRALVRMGYEAYNRGERGFLSDVIDDEIEWTIHGPTEAFPIPNRMRGKAEVLAAMERLDELVEVVRNEIVRIVIDGEWAAVIFERTVRQRTSGRTFTYKACGFHRYRDGRLVEYEGFMDSFELVQRALGRTIEVQSLHRVP
jgi:ketosteroid isomerase-like protein